MIEITYATPDNAALIADMSRETFRDTFAEFNTKEDMDLFLAEQFSRESLIAEVGAEGNFFLIAWYDSEPAGYLFLKTDHHALQRDESTIEISRLYAKTSFIGKGIGKALMQAAIAQARSMQKNSIWLGVWEHNKRAIDFYRSFGFEKFGEHDFILGKDVQRDWEMRMVIRN